MTESAVQLNETEQLPDGWRWVKLGEVANVFSGSSAPQDAKYFQGGTYPFVRVQDLGRVGRTSNLTDVRDKVNDVAVQEVPLVKARAGTILFPKSGAAIHTNSRAILRVDAYIVSHLAAIEPIGTFVDNEWVYFWLCTQDMAHYSENIGYPSLKLSVIDQIPIPLPPLPEQKRIATKIQELTGEMERARTACEARLEAAKALPKAYLRQVFESEEAKKWERRRLGEVAKIVNGFGFPNYLQGNTKLQFPFVKVADMNLPGNEIYVSYAANTVNESILRELNARTYPSGTVIFPKVGGAIATNKKRILSVNATFDNNIMGVVPSASISSEWVYCLLQSIDLASMSRTTAVPSIRQSDIASLVVPVPPLPSSSVLSQKLKTNWLIPKN